MCKQSIRGRCSPPMRPGYEGNMRKDTRLSPFLPHACMHEGVKQSVFSVWQSVSQSVSPVKNFEI